jgi:serine/alanine adding enzyme
VLVVKVGGVTQASAMLVRHGASIEVPWAAAVQEAKRNGINMRMYWELLTFSVGQGALSFDFGRSTVDSGTYRFKQQWGARPQQLYWHYWLPEGRPIPQLNQSNPKYALAGAIWRHMPLWCANRIGPLLVRSLP